MDDPQIVKAQTDVILSSQVVSLLFASNSTWDAFAIGEARAFFAAGHPSSTRPPRPIRRGVLEQIVRKVQDPEDPLL